MGAFRTFFTAVKLTLATQMTYRFNFLLTIFVMLMFNLAAPLVTLLIYTNSKGFQGWSASQILVFQGSAIMLWGLEQVFFGNVTWELNRIVREGQFDKLLTQPIGPLRSLLFTQMAIESLPEIAIGAALIILGLAQSGAAVSIILVLYMFFFVALGFLFLSSLVVIQMSLVVRFVQVRRLGELLRTGSTMGFYPGTIYPKALQSVIFGFLPYGLIAFFPASAVLGQLNEFPIIAVIATGIFIALAAFMWDSSIKRYTSAGG